VPNRRKENEANIWTFDRYEPKGKGRITFLSLINKKRAIACQRLTPRESLEIHQNVNNDEGGEPSTKKTLGKKNEVRLVQSGGGGLGGLCENSGFRPNRGAVLWSRRSRRSSGVLS